MSRKRVIIGLAALFFISLVVSAVIAADEDTRPARGERGPRTRGERDTGRRGPEAGRGGPNAQPGGDMASRMAEFQKRMMNIYKENLGASDTEWKIIEPKLNKVLEIQRQSRFSGMRGMMGRGMMGRGRGGDRGSRGGADRGGDRGGRGSRESDRPETEIQKASAALADVLEKKSSTSEQIKAKLLELRKAKEKAKQTLAAAQKDLKSVLTVRQEATLVSSGILE